MKKLSLLLALTMLLSVLAFAGCTETNNGGDDSSSDPDTSFDSESDSTVEDTDEVPASAFSSALDLYNAVWEQFAEDDKFPCGGGDVDHMAEGPGLFVMNEENADSFKYYLHVTDELYDMIDGDTATLQHMMNLNTFSSAAIRLKDSADAASFAEAYKDAIQAQHWMCGFPDKVVVVAVDDYLLIAYGHEGNINNLVAACAAVDAQSSVLVDAPAEV